MASASTRRLFLGGDYLKVLIQLMLALLPLPILFYNLSDTPAFFYDEGYFGQIAKNTAIYGRYGSIFDRDFVPAQLSVGPTVLLPVSAVYRFFGVGIWQTRVVVAVAGFFLLLMLYQLTCKLYDSGVGVVAWSLALLSTVPYSRMLLGEVPAICFLLVGLWCWLRSMEEKSTISAVSAGLALGMMLVSKPQTVLVMPALLVAAVMNALYYRCCSWRLLFIAALVAPVPMLLSILFQASNLGWSNYLAYLTVDLTHGSRSSVISSQGGLGLRDPNYAGSMTTLVLIGVVCFLLSIRDCRERSPQALLKLTMLIMAMSSLFWYVALSPGWGRYALPSKVLLVIFAAACIVEGARRVGGFLSSSRRKLWGIALQVTVVLSFSVPIMFAVFSDGNEQIRDIAAAVEQHVEPGALIETYEWTVDVLTNRHYHHPDLIHHGERVRYYMFAEPIEPPIYKYWDNNPDYLVVGPMGQYLKAYPRAQLEHCAELIVDRSPYALYRLAESDCFERYAQ